MTRLDRTSEGLAGGTPAAEGFALTELEQDGVAVIVVAGELDLATAPALDARLAAIAGEAVVVDLWSCSFLDSSALEVLLRHRRRRDRFAVACTPGGAADHLFDLAGVADGDPGLLSVFGAREKAIEALAGADAGAAESAGADHAGAQEPGQNLRRATFMPLLGALSADRGPDTTDARS
jgi:anti-anti-sigma factor